MFHADTRLSPLAADMDLLFERDRVYLHNATGGLLQGRVRVHVPRYLHFVSVLPVPRRRSLPLVI